MPAPLVTVAITCFDAQDTIARAIRSAQRQDWPHLEIVVVDDASRDRSAAIVAELAASDERVRLIRHDANRGPGAARQSLLDNARGDVMVFFDDDDESSPERVTVQHTRLQEYRASAQTSLVACYASGTRVYENGYRMALDAIGSSATVPVGEQVADYLLFNRRQNGVGYGAGTPACALMASVATLRAAGGFDPAFRRVEDVDFAVRLALLGGHFVGCPERLFVQYATHAPDKSARRNFEAEMQLLDKHRDYLDRRGRYRFARNWFTVRFHHFNHDRARMLLALTKGWVRDPLLVTRQLLTTVPARYRHERRASR